MKVALFRLGDFLVLAMIPGEIGCLKSAAGAATSMLEWIGWLGEMRSVTGVIGRGG